MDIIQSLVFICVLNLIQLMTLIELLRNKFNLKSSVHKTTNGNRLYIHGSSKDDLLQLIKPYLLSHFYYKFNI